MNDFRAAVNLVLHPPVVAPTSYRVKIITDVLRIRKTPSLIGLVVGKVYRNDTFTIVETKNGWGKLKSGAGWINLGYTKRV